MARVSSRRSATEVSHFFCLAYCLAVVGLGSRCNWTEYFALFHLFLLSPNQVLFSPCFILIIASPQSLFTYNVNRIISNNITKKTTLKHLKTSNHSNKTLQNTQLSSGTNQSHQEPCNCPMTLSAYD